MVAPTIQIIKTINGVDCYRRKGKANLRNLCLFGAKEFKSKINKSKSHFSMLFLTKNSRLPVLSFNQLNDKRKKIVMETFSHSYLNQEKEFFYLFLVGSDELLQRFGKNEVIKDS